MEKKDFKKVIWKTIEPIEFPNELMTQLKKYENSDSKEYHLLLKQLKKPKTQKEILLKDKGNLLENFALYYLQNFIENESCIPLRDYTAKLQSYLRDKTQSEDLREAEHEMLCFMIRVYLNEISQPIFKRFLTILFLFPEYIQDFKLLNSILDYYSIYDKKL